MKKIYVMLLIAFLLPLQLVVSAQSAATAIVSPILLSSIASTGESTSGTPSQTTGAYAELKVQDQDLCSSSQQDKLTCSSTYFIYKYKLFQCSNGRWNFQSDITGQSNCQLICEARGNCIPISEARVISSLPDDSMTSDKSLIGTPCGKKDLLKYTCLSDYSARRGFNCNEQNKGKAVCGGIGSSYNILECNGQSFQQSVRQPSGVVQNIRTLDGCSKRCIAIYGESNCIKTEPIQLARCVDPLIGSPEWSRTIGLGIYTIYTRESCVASCKLTGSCFLPTDNEIITNAPGGCTGSGFICQNPKQNFLESGAVFIRSDCSTGTLCRNAKPSISDRTSCLAASKSLGTQTIWCTQEKTNDLTSAYCTTSSSCLSGYTTDPFIKATPYVPEKSFRNGNLVTLAFNIVSDASIEGLKLYITSGGSDIFFDIKCDIPAGIERGKTCSFTKTFAELPEGNVDYGFSYNLENVDVA